MKWITALFLLLTFGSSITIENSWIRPAAKGSNSAFYFDAVNTSDQPDTLYKAASDLAKIVEVHESYMVEDRKGMRKVDFVVIPANQTFNFKPGGFHVMLIKTNQDLTEGTKGKVTLYFKRAGAVEVEAVVGNN